MLNEYFHLLSVFSWCHRLKVKMKKETEVYYHFFDDLPLKEGEQTFRPDLEEKWRLKGGSQTRSNRQTIQFSVGKNIRRSYSYSGN
jgi:hypothetical protein